MSKQNDGIRIALLSLHGLVRGTNMELGRDEDTGGQIKYVVELARALGETPGVAQVDLITRQISDERVSKDYAAPTEPLSARARIVRIPFGPKRYLHKTSFWPYIDMFVDQCLAHLKRTRTVPDVIHGHYADAGYGGGQLARLLGIPFIFTGHSLGRVKKQRLLEHGMSMDSIEKKFQINRRIEAEEFALETCSLIVTSTHQEVREQYELYEHYIPERMEVIPPGVDLDAFYPADDNGAAAPIEPVIDRFLDDPGKPVILTMARPDERKNLEMLVRVYGESPELQRRANLVLIMGTREDIREMPSGQRGVLTRILTLIDVYDLYGKVAYPKAHRPSDPPDLYRLAQKRRGVFINPALTEPFGLTLLEAAASGVPIVATSDGGPQDILANCQNGLLIDPLDPRAIEKALLQMLTEEAKWDNWSQNGLVNVNQHYSWRHHTERYMRDVQLVLDSFHAPPDIITGRNTRRITDIDRLILADVDNTLTGDEESMLRFFELVKHADANIGYGIATGRRFEDATALLKDLNVPPPDLLITSVGTEIYYGKNFTRDESWRRHIDFRWEPEKVRSVLREVPGLWLQEDNEQSTYKISYRMDPEVAPGVPHIRRLLRENGVRAKVILSLGMFLDIIPSRAGSGLSIRHLAYKWELPIDHILVAGDSGNDEEMLAGSTLGVVVGNYSPELEKLRKFPKVYFAEQHHAAGIIEGIEHYQFLHDIRIPEEEAIH
jgi:sucrose-phosphate synthase